MCMTNQGTVCASVCTVWSGLAQFEYKSEILPYVILKRSKLALSCKNKDILNQRICLLSRQTCLHIMWCMQGL